MPGQGMTTLPPTKSIQSYLTTCGLQNSSNPELIPFWQGKNVSALSPCFDSSHLLKLMWVRMPPRKGSASSLKACSVLINSSTYPEFWNELMTSTEVPLCIEYTVRKPQGCSVENQYQQTWPQVKMICWFSNWVVCSFTVKFWEPSMYSRY